MKQAKTEGESQGDWPSRRLALKGTVKWGSSPVQASLQRKWGIGGPQHAIQHTKPHPGAAKCIMQAMMPS